MMNHQTKLKDISNLQKQQMMNHQTKLKDISNLQKQQMMNYQTKLKDISNQISQQANKVKPQATLLMQYTPTLYQSEETHTMQVTINDQQQYESDNGQEQDYSLSNIQQFQKAQGIKVDQSNSLYPSAFKLINIPKKQKSITIYDLMSVNFNVLSYSISQLINFSTEILFSNQYAQQIYSNKHNVRQLVKLMARKYRTVSYHNFSHAFSLMQLNFQCLQMESQFKSYFTHEQIFYTLIAGLAHDMNHYGTNNMFQIKRKTEISILYNKESVLQKMHISQFYSILQQNPDLNFLSLTQIPKYAKQIITRLIMSTDMSLHFKSLQVLKRRKESNDIDFNKFHDRLFMMEQLFHSCDLGNPTLQFQNYISWAALLTFQFNQQAKQQKLLEIQISKCFQYQDITTFFKDQTFFVGNIVLPLWKQLTNSLTMLNVFIERIQQNIEILKQSMEKQNNKVRLIKPVKPK